MKSLDDFGKEYDSVRSSNVHNYLGDYEILLRHSKNKKISILIIEGHFLKECLAFVEYYPLATVVVFLSEHAIICDVPEHLSSRLFIYGPATPSASEYARAADHGPFDLIIENCHHYLNEQLLAVDSLFLTLKGGGYFVIEGLTATTIAGTSLENYPNLSGVFCQIAESHLQGRPSGLGLTPSKRQMIDNSLLSVGFSKERMFLQRRSLDDATEAVFKAVTFEEKSVDSVIAISECTYTLPQPTLINAPGGHLERISENFGEIHAPAARVGIVRDALIYGEGTIVTRDGQLIRETLMHAPVVPYFNDIGSSLFALTDFKKPARIEGNNIVAFKQRWDSNYGHWLIETLPRIVAIGKIYPLESCRFILTAWSVAMKEVMKESLALSGVPEENLCFVSGEPIFADEVIYCTPITKRPFIIPPFCVDFLRSISHKRMQCSDYKPGPERVYISRNKYGRRQITNEEEVFAVLQSYGYERVFPETLSFSEQVDSFSNATHVVGNLGAAITNVAFARDKVDLLALTSEHMGDDFFWNVVSHRGGRYISLHGKVDDPQMEEASRVNPDLWMQCNFKIDIALLREILDSFHSCN